MSQRACSIADGRRAVFRRKYSNNIEMKWYRFHSRSSNVGIQRAFRTVEVHLNTITCMTGGVTVPATRSLWFMSNQHYQNGHRIWNKGKRQDDERESASKDDELKEQ